MAEAMLHHVRRGKKVAAIYYGHPGIYSTPTHRAIQIARREGHLARMRPGISALDYIVAEVGFDPAIPGLLSYEASDMLLRDRVIDPRLHLVIWQVGLVGDFGFNNNGFTNKGFQLLVKKLSGVYGEAHALTHYTASYYAGIDSIIEKIPIAELKDPDIERSISALSTFYIEPKTGMHTNPRAAWDLELTKTQDGQPYTSLNPDSSPENPAGKKIFHLRKIEPPANYTIPIKGPEFEFIMNLMHDRKLLKEYQSNPEHILSKNRYPDLSARARKLLSIPHPLAFERCLFEAK